MRAVSKGAVFTAAVLAIWAVGVVACMAFLGGCCPHEFKGSAAKHVGQDIAERIVWVEGFEEQADPPEVEWRDETCVTPDRQTIEHAFLWDDGTCHVSGSGLFSQGCYRVILAWDINEPSFPKWVYAHEMLHAYIYLNRLPDRPLHSNALWAILPILIDRMTAAGVP